MTTPPPTGRRRLRRAKRTVDDSRMTLVEHVYELRSRLLKAMIALVLGTVVSFVFYDQIFDVLRAPYCDLPLSTRGGTDASCNLIALKVLDLFFLKLKVSMIAGALLASPVWLYQLWAFITPGLHRHEKRYATSFVGVGVLLFSAGAFFAYLTLGKGLQFLLSFAGDGVTPTLEVTGYLNYVIAILLVFGVSFLFPLVVVMLNVAGLLSSQRMRSWRRGVIFGIFFFSAIITPSQDPFTMSAMALPLCLFYEGSIVFGRLNDKRRAKRQVEAERELDDYLAERDSSWEVT